MTGSPSARDLGGVQNDIFVANRDACFGGTGPDSSRGCERRKVDGEPNA